MENEKARPSSKQKIASDRRKQILRAAVEVFAERGFHRTRVSDIASRAGVAYGLIYHYFESKDDVLNSVFEENWAVFLKVLKEIRDREQGSEEKLEAIAGLLIDALRMAPDLIQVIIQEISRSDRFNDPPKVNAFEEAFGVARDIIKEGQERGDIEPALDPQVASYVFLGALETVCTGFLFKTIQCGTENEAIRVKETITRTMLRGILNGSASKD